MTLKCFFTLLFFIALFSNSIQTDINLTTDVQPQLIPETLSLSDKIESKPIQIKIEETPKTEIQTSPIERNLKDSFKEAIDTDDLTEVMSPITIDSETGKHQPIRKLNFDGNPVFASSMHQQNINYFQLTIHDYDRNIERITAATNFIHAWMGITEENEECVVSPLRIRNVPANNRFSVRYRNNDSGSEKQYFIDIDFTDGFSDRRRVRNARIVDYMRNDGSSNDYLRDYEFTLEEDCHTIQQARHNPQEIECRPFLTRDRFVIPHVYNVIMRFVTNGRQIRRTGRFFVRAKIIGPESAPLTPARVVLPSNRRIIDMVRNRVNTSPFFETRGVVLHQLRQPDMALRVEHYTEEILEWENRNRNRMRQAETTYHQNLRRELRTDRRNKQNDEINFETTYALMRRAANMVNAFNIRSTIRRTVRRLEDRQSIRAHRAKMRYYQREIALMNLIERLDHMRYLTDKHLDENFDHYYSPEYFKK